MFRVVSAEPRAALRRAWARLPDELRGPTRFMGQQYAGCGATIGAMPRCDFSGSGCDLGAEANHAKPKPLAELESRFAALRSGPGPGGNVQLTGFPLPGNR